ncbi:hypothetical protein JTB14_027124 [Gonioctena quinquepunctata]|nr:hypothetical protein JTB14_027124 [Gonioctena quinquepunctata]
MVESKNKAEDPCIKLGYLGITNMKKLLPLVYGLNLIKQDEDQLNQPCEICVEAKQTSFFLQMERLPAERPLQFINSDICEPFTSETWDGKRYILFLLDDFTHFTMIYLLETESEEST